MQICNQQVVGSSPTAGFLLKFLLLNRLRELFLRVNYFPERMLRHFSATFSVQAHALFRNSGDLFRGEPFMTGLSIAIGGIDSVGLQQTFKTCETGNVS